MLIASDEEHLEAEVGLLEAEALVEAMGIRAAVLLGLACALLAQLAAVAPHVHIWYEAAGAGIIVGLSAAGLYSGTKTTLVSVQRRGTDSA